jgi:predicted RNase H-like nuclease (RuvC/YqgF family)
MEAIADFLHTPDSLRLKDQEAFKANTLQTGFIAQEVEKAASELGFDFSGVDKPKNKDDFYGLRYAEFTVPLVKAVQELNDKNNNLQHEIELLQNENTQLKSKIQEFDILKSENQNIKSDIEKIKTQLNSTLTK